MSPNERFGSAIDFFSENETPEAALHDCKWHSIRNDFARAKSDRARLGTVECRFRNFAACSKFGPRYEAQSRIGTNTNVCAGEKVGHGSGGVVLLRAAAKGGQWLAFQRVIRTRGMAGDVWLGQLRGGAAVCFRRGAQ